MAPASQLPAELQPLDAPLRATTRGEPGAVYPMPSPEQAGMLAQAQERGRARKSLAAMTLVLVGVVAMYLTGNAPDHFSVSQEAGLKALTALNEQGRLARVVQDESAVQEPEGPCLCVFDIDRTLTCKQGWAGQCDGTQERGGVEDTAFEGGTMVLSQFAANVQSTFCGKCFHGIVSAGDAGGEGSGERQALFESLGGTEKMGVDHWQDINWDENAEATTPLLVHAVDGKKQDSVRAMLSWWRNHQQLDIKDENVWFFDDLLKNVEGFRDSGFNAAQISCKSRGPQEQWVSWAGKVGGCGATVDEIVPKKGVHICEGVPVKPDDVED